MVLICTKMLFSISNQILAPNIMKRFLLALASLSLLALTSCGILVPCSCAPPTGFRFLFDTKGENISTTYQGLEIQYSYNGSKYTVPNINFMMVAPKEYSNQASFEASGILSIVTTKNVSEFEIWHSNKKIGTLTLKVREKNSNGQYEVQSISFNGQTLTHSQTMDLYMYSFPLK